MNFFTSHKIVKFSVFTQNIVRIFAFATMFFMTALAMANDVAKIGNTSYSSLKEAINAVPNNGIATAISLIDDISADEGFFITDNRNVILNLEGKTIDFTENVTGITVREGCQLSINGSGVMKITCSTYRGQDNRTVIYAKENTKVMINGGDYVNDSFSPTIATYGELCINYGSFTNNGTFWVISCFKQRGVIYNGKFKGMNTINNCTVYGGLHSSRNVYTNMDFYKFIANTDPNTNKDYPYTVSYPVIEDGCTYNQEKDVDLTGNKLTYSRYFDNTDWQQLYVPFDIPGNLWSKYYEIAEPTDFKNGKFIITKLDEDETVKANDIYLIRAKSVAADGEDFYISIDNAKLKANTVTEKRLSEGTLFSCNGFLKKSDWMDIANGKCYILKGNKLSQYDLSSFNDNVLVMTPQRWFFSADRPINNTYDITIYTRATDIDIVDNEYKNNDIMYNITGQRVNKNAKGIVIINGKKRLLNLQNR